MRTTATLIGIPLSALLLAGCGAEDNGEPAAEEPAAEQTGPAASVSGVFAAYGADAEAVSYDAAVPEGASAEVDVEPETDGTEFTLEVEGLEPDRDYGAHLHTAACGADPDDSGPHYQDEADPEQPSTDPAYANAENEVWLDFTTDQEGEADVEATVAWQPRPGEANSVVIHAEHTHTEPGEAGTAGDRLACLTVPL